MRPRRIPPSIAVAAVLVLTLSIGEARAGLRPARARAKLLTFVNHYRVDHGRARLRDDHGADRIAQHHSHRMASARTLFHSSGMWTKLRGKHATCWGENVGMGPSVWRVYRAWVHSAEHRANMLGGRYRRAGIGVVRAHGTFWITMIYYG